MKKKANLTQTRFDNCPDCKVITKLHGGNSNKFLVQFKNQYCVLKVSKSTENALAFQKEAESILSLGGNNSLILYDYLAQRIKQENEMPWILIDYIPSISLHSLLEVMRGTNTDPGTRLELKPLFKYEIIFAISYILRGIHDKKYAHRDVKPVNILIDPHFNVHLIDFSIISKEQTKTIKGTRNFMPPEFYVEENDDDENKTTRMIPADPKNDVYSFGCTLLQILTYHWPFDDPKDADVDVLAEYTAKGIFDTRFDPGNELSYSVSDDDRELYDIIKECWAFDPKDRPTMDEISRKIYEIAKKKLSEEDFKAFNRYGCALNPKYQQIEKDSKGYYVVLKSLGNVEEIYNAVNIGFCKIGSLCSTQNIIGKDDILTEIAKSILNIDEETVESDEKFNEFKQKYCVIKKYR